MRRLMFLVLVACGGGGGGSAVDGGADAAGGGWCGDGVVDDGEACDDGNPSDTDACVACAWASCGDGHVRAGVEECDDDATTCVGCLACAGLGAGGHCYTIVEDARTRASAADACGLAGGHLAAIDDDAEWAALAPLWVDPFPSTWVGLVRAADGQDAWRWDTGAPLGAPRWNAGEPNDAGGIEDCVEAFGAEGRWNDLDCNQTRRALCERAPWTVSPATGHAYRVIHRRRTHPEAIADCSALGAHLATVSSAEEQALIRAVAPIDAWIGAFQGQTENAWFWSTGEPFEFTAWGAGQPDDFAAAEDCVHLTLADGAWNDLACTARLPYVCEID